MGLIAMSRARLTYVLENDLLELPQGDVLVFGASADDDLTALPKERVTIVQGFYPDYAALKARGYNVIATPDDRAVAAALVFLPRAKPLARNWIAQAGRASKGGLVVVDGQKTDGVDSLLKHIKKRVPIDGVEARAHGRTFWFQAADFDDWETPRGANRDGFLTEAGVFSADGVDRASGLLVAALPSKLKGVIADLGAGWGYLAHHLVAMDGVKAVHLVEADAAALDCARANVTSDKAQFHWADATDFSLPERVDHVVMNPPFHTERKPDPELGKRFIAAAARQMKGHGQLFLVANRHLPYETVLTERFAHVTEAEGDRQFKILVASRPRR